MNVFKANNSIVEKLRSVGALLHSQKFTHSYPHCWRCHNPLIFLATEQWFVGVDHNGLREKVIDAIDQREVVPRMVARSNSQHDRDAARLDYLASARMGRADSRGPMRRM